MLAALLASLSTTLIPALLPTVTHLVTAGVQKVTGLSLPPNVDDQVKIMTADTERLKALGALDSVGDTYRWVNAIRGLMRPVAAIGILGSYCYCMIHFKAAPGNLSDYAQSVTFYMFGERTLMYARRKGGK